MVYSPDRGAVLAMLQLLQQMPDTAYVTRNVYLPVMRKPTPQALPVIHRAGVLAAASNNTALAGLEHEFPSWKGGMS